jgi:hypothetical protein
MKFSLVIRIFSWYSFRLVSVCVLACLFASCSSITPHENFIQQMKVNVGRVFNSDTMTWGGEKHLVRVKTLPGGKVEREYRFYGECRFFFEVDPATNIVASWRYEGSEEDCAISN